MTEIKPETAWLESILRYHETGGHEGDGSDHAMRNARAELDGVSPLLNGLREARDGLSEVMRYRRGEGKYRFASLPVDERECAAFDAWQEVEAKVAGTLANLDTLLSQEGGQ